MKWKILIPVAAFAVLAAGAVAWLVFFTGETAQEVLDRYAPQFQAKRRQLREIADKLPPPGSARQNQGRAGLNPRPVYDPPNRSFNTSVLMFEHLRDPDARLRTPEQVDFVLFEGNLLMHLQWTGPQNPMSAPGSTRARPELAGELETTLRQPYLVVVRTVRYQRPVILTDQKTFVGGTLDAEAFLVDLRSTEVVGSVRFGARAAEVVQTIKGRDADWIYSSMMGRARTELARALEQVSGGKFVFEFGGGR